MNRYIAILLAVLLMGSLCACGSDTSVSSETSQGRQEAAETGNKENDKIDEKTPEAEMDTAETGPQHRLVKVSTSGNMVYLLGYSSDEFKYKTALVGVWTFDYDDDGKLISETYATNNSDYNSVTEWTYNSQGQKLTEILYGSDGEVVQEGIYTYHDNGELATVELTNFISGVVNYDSYDPHGNTLITETRDTNSVTSRIEYAYTYNEQGKMLTREQTVYGEKAPKTTIWTYTETGKVLTRTDNFPDGSATLTKYEYDVYDSDGRWLIITATTGSGIVTVEKTCYGHEGNNILYESRENDGKLESTIEYTRDADGKLLTMVQTVYPRSGSATPLTYTTTYTYHPNGKLMMENEIRLDNSIEDSRMWEYDEYGNLLKFTADTVYTNDTANSYHWEEVYEYEEIPS